MSIRVPSFLGFILLAFCIPDPILAATDAASSLSEPGVVEFRMVTFDSSDLDALRVRWEGHTGLFPYKKVKLGKSLRLTVPAGRQRFSVSIGAGGSREHWEEVTVEPGKVTPVDLIVSFSGQDYRSRTFNIQVLARTPVAKGGG